MPALLCMCLTVLYFHVKQQQAGYLNVPVA